MDYQTAEENAALREENARLQILLAGAQSQVRNLEIEKEELCRDKRKNDRMMAACFAMQGILANPETDELQPREIATDAVRYADALLTALEEG